VVRWDVRLISGLLVLIAVAVVCASYHRSDPLLTLFRATEAAAAAGAILFLAHLAGCAPIGGLPWRQVRFIAAPPAAAGLRCHGFVMRC